MAWNNSQTFTTPCVFYNFTVPAGVTIINVFLWGAMGVFYESSRSMVSGAYVEGRLFVTPGEQLRVTVGGRGVSEACGLAGAVSYRSGGGFSALARLNAVNSAWEYLVVAGGAGGGYLTHFPNEFSTGGRGIPRRGCGDFDPSVPSCELYDSDVGGGWIGGKVCSGSPHLQGQGGTSCAPGLISGTVVSIDGVPGVAPNARLPFYVPGAGHSGGFGQVTLTWVQPVGSPSFSPTRIPSATPSASLPPSSSPTATRSAASTVSISATATLSPYCLPSTYRAFPNSNMDGGDAAPPQLVRSEWDCARACCDVPACQAYTFNRDTILLGGSHASCFLLANGA